MRIGNRLDRYAGWVAVLLLCLIFVIELGQSSINLLWYDELITLGTASFPHWIDIWKFYAQGLDAGGPLPSLIVHGALNLPFGPETSSRLPFMLAFLVMCLCIYSFVRHRYPPGYALAALIFPVSLPFFFHSTDARYYAPMLAGAGSAMLCWQSAVSFRKRPWSVLGLWMGLSFAIFAHAFAIFLFVPFALAQLVRDCIRGKSDWAMWAAIVFFPVGLAPVLEGLRLANEAYGPSYWSRPALRWITFSYKDFSFGGWDFIGMLLVFAVGVAILQRQGTLPSPEAKTCGFSLPEWVLVAALACMPFYVVPGSYLLHVYRPVYVLPFCIGVIMLLVGAVAEAARREGLAGGILLVLFLLATIWHASGRFIEGIHTLIHPGRVHAELQANYRSQAWVRLLEKNSLPVAAGDPLLYAQLGNYATPELRHRLYYLTDMADVKEYPDSASLQLNFVRFGKLLSYQTMDIRDFLRGNPRFLLAVGGDPATWLQPYLIRQEEAGNATLRLLGPDFSGSNVYDVQFTRMPFPVGRN